MDIPLRNSTHEDQRWNTRQPLKLDVSLYHSLSGKQQFMSTQTDNISMGGMFIHSSIKNKLKINDSLSVSFTLQTKQGVSHHRLPVRVVRTTKMGAALAFNDYNIDTIHMLREILYDENQIH
jgi:PilZ domain